VITEAGMIRVELNYGDVVEQGLRFGCGYHFGYLET